MNRVAVPRFDRYHDSTALEISFQTTLKILFIITQQSALTSTCQYTYTHTKHAKTLLKPTPKMSHFTDKKCVVNREIRKSAILMHGAKRRGSQKTKENPKI